MRALVILCLGLVSCGGSVTNGDTTADAGGDARIERPAAETGASCTRTGDRVAISIAGAIASTCAEPGSDAGAPLDVVGSIVGTTSTSFDLDTCSPAADCIPLISTVHVEAPGLDLRTLKTGSYVRVKHEAQSFFGCHASIVVTSVAAWDGAKNPVDEGDRLYLAAGDGHDPPLPFPVDRVPLHCLSGVESCGGGIAPDHYAYSFAGTAIAMGETKSFAADGQTFEARNLRAVYDGACDAYWDFAFWLVER